MSQFRLTPDGRIQLSENDVRAACLDVVGEVRRTA